jgi:hypothetical protein
MSVWSTSLLPCCIHFSTVYIYEIIHLYLNEMLYRVSLTDLFINRFHPFIGHKGPYGEYSYSSTLFLTSALEGGEGSASHPGPTLPPERPGTHCTGGCLGLRAVLDRCGKSRPHRDLIPGTSSP